MIYEKVLAEHDRLEKEIIELEQQLKEYPEGKLFITRNGKHYKWYQTDGHTQVYLPKKERGLAEQLAVKKYLSCKVEELKQEKKAIEFYLRHHNNNSSETDRMLLVIVILYLKGNNRKKSHIK